jgi:hypothetical protein
MSKFTLDISKFAEKAGAEADKFVRKVCLDLTTSIVLKTPVDTGRARANWQTSINTPAAGVINFSADAGSGITAPKQSTASMKAIADATALLKQAPGNVFWITNNLPYIGVLEFGSYSPGPKTIGGFSRQAPNGMVRISINELKRALR